MEQTIDPPADAAPTNGAGAHDPDRSVDEVIDLTDRRRIMLRTVFGVAVPADTANEVFAPGDEPDPVTPRR